MSSWLLSQIDSRFKQVEFEIGFRIFRLELQFKNTENLDIKILFFNDESEAICAIRLSKDEFGKYYYGEKTPKIKFKSDDREQLAVCSIILSKLVNKLELEEILSIKRINYEFSIKFNYQSIIDLLR